MGGASGGALHRPGRAPRRAARPDRPARAPRRRPRATPGPTARPTCSTSAASRRATTRRCPGCSPAAATRSGSRPTATAWSFDLGPPHLGVHPRRRRAVSPARAHRPHARPPACAASCASAAACRRCCPSGRYGHWKSRDVYEHQRAVEDDFDGYARNRIALDAIVIDSPWETQYNTWEPNPHQFDDFEEMVRRFRARRGAHGGLGDPVGQPRVGRRPAPARPGVGAPAPRAGAELRAGGARGALREDRRRRAVRGALVDGHRLAGRLHLAARRGVVARAGQDASWRWASRASRPTTARATTSRPTSASPTAAAAPRRPGRYGLLYRRSMQRALDEVHPGRRAVRPLGLDRPAGGRLTWGGDQASDFWSLRDAGDRHPDRGRQRLLELVPRRRRLPRRAARGPLPQGAAAALGLVRVLHAADAGARPLRRRRPGPTTPRRSPPTAPPCCCTSGSCPTSAPRRPTAARTGLPIVRPLLLGDPSDERGWTLADQYGYGPALWVAPVLEEGAREREVVAAPRRLDRPLDRASATAAAASCSRRRRSTGSRSMRAPGRSW